MSKPAVPALPKASNFAKGGSRTEKKNADADEVGAAVLKITTQRKIDPIKTDVRNPVPFSPVLQQKEEPATGATKDGGMAIGPYKPAQLKSTGISENLQRYEGSQQQAVSGSPVLQAKEAVPINDDPGLEKEADEMGEKAMQQKAAGSRNS